MKNGRKQRKWFNVILAVVLAFGLWLYVVNVENPTGSIHLRDLPVTVQNEDVLEQENLMITDMSREDLSIKVTGKRKTLMKLNRKNTALSVDASTIEGEGTWSLTARVIWPDNVNSEAMSVSSWDTLKVNVTVEKRETKKIPVEGTFIGKEKEGFRAQKVRTDPETLEISGTADALEGITHALVQIGGANVSETIEQKAPVVLMGPEGLPEDLENVTLSESEVTVTVPILKVVSVPFTVDLIDGGGALASDAVVKISPEAALLAEPAEDDDLPDSILLGSIPLNEIYNTTSYVFPVKLPQGVTGLNVPNTASVQVSLKKLASHRIAVKNIALTGVPYGFRGEPVADTFSVWVRGDPIVVSKLTADQIRAEADLSSAKAVEGVQRVPLKITIQGLEADAQVGIVGTKHSIAVRLSR